MRCEDIAVELDAYSTGELDAETCAEIERHIRQCPSCLDELAKLREESALYRNYVSAVAGHAAENEKRRSTETILTRPSERRRGSFSIFGWRWAAAAMIIVAIGLFWHLRAYRSTSGAPDINESVIAEQSEVVSEVVSMNQALKDLDQAIVLLQASYLKKKPQLDPELVKELDRNLEITRAAIRECKEALKKDSGNRQASEFLAFVYQKQIDILKHSLGDL